MMPKDEYCKRLHNVIYTAGFNSRFHQILESKYEWRDKAVRVAVAGFAVLGLIFSVPKFDELVGYPAIPWFGFLVAVVSLFLAVILNIIPVVEKAKFHGYMFRAWSELRADTVLVEQKTCDIDPVSHHIDRLNELTVKMESLHALEPFADQDLLEKCQGDEREAEWGKGIRTDEDIEAGFFTVTDPLFLDRATAYKSVLNMLVINSAPTVKQFVLDVARWHYALGRPDGKLTVYDEQAIQNDILMHCKS